VTASRRLWTVIQPFLVRGYKLVGLLALTAVIVGLLAFLTVNIFYFFDTSWVRPVVVDHADPRVIAVTNQLADAQTRKARLADERVEIAMELSNLERMIRNHEAFLADARAQPAPTTHTGWRVRRAIADVELEKHGAIAWRVPLEHRLTRIDAQLAGEAAVIARLHQSPFWLAAERVMMAFVPYENLAEDVEVGSPLYSCAWGLLRCSKVGKVTAILDGEVVGTHPHDEDPLRGRYVKIEVGEGVVGDSVLFTSKPLWIF
jgi:hypothetical protein